MTDTLEQASRHHEAGDYEAAIPLYRKTLAARPEDVDAMRLLAVALAQAGHHGEAERIAKRAAALAPDYAVVWANLGTVLAEAERHEDSIDAFRRACDLQPHSASAHFNLGNALGAASDAEPAIVAYRRALALQPDHPGGLIGLGHMLKTVGQGNDARDAYYQALAAKPDYGQVWWSLANLKTHRFIPADVNAMEAVISRPDLPPATRAATLFALGKARDDERDYDAAFACYTEANALQRTLVRYDPAQTELLNDRIIDVFDAELFASHAGQGCDDPAPIFIVGLPRSGSTLIEQILASHSRVDGTSELPALGRLAMSVGKHRSDGVVYPEGVPDLEAADFDALGRAYLARTRRHRKNAPFFTDKMPNNFPTIGFAHLILPRAKIIDARRHPLDACVGCFRQLFARGQTFTYDLFELAEYYRQYQRMMSWWDQVLPGRVLRVDYERMVTDQVTQTRRLLEFCGLPWEDACLSFHRTQRPVNTASSEQVRQPLYNHALGSWRRYARHLNVLEERLSDIIEALPADIRDAGIS